MKTITKPIGGEKNGRERVVVVKKGSKWYPADDVKKPVPSRKHVHKKTKLRKSIKPGSVLVLLSGVYTGMRVIFLKQLPSGLLLVTGPFSVNGIPMRRVDQSYVIATSTVVDVSGVDVSKFDDSYFKRSDKTRKSTTDQEQFMETNAPSSGKKLTEEMKSDQKAVDSAIVSVVAKDPMLKQYLRSKFTLHKGQFPHQMKF